MWDVIKELGQTVREALRDWPGTLRLLCVLAAVPARSHDPGRYRAVIVAVAEQVLRDVITGELSEADTNAVFRAAYPQYFAEPGCAENTCHKRFRRARADMRALLQAVVRRDELQP